MQSISFSARNFLGALLPRKETVKQKHSMQSISFSARNFLGALLPRKETVKQKHSMQSISFSARNFLGAFKEASLTRPHLLALLLRKETVR